MQQLGESFFYYFHHHGRISHLRLGDQKMKVFGHHDVADDYEAILLPGALQDTQEQITPLGAVKLRTPLITAAGYEMEVVPTIPALQTLRHASKVSWEDGSRL